MSFHLRKKTIQLSHSSQALSIIVQLGAISTNATSITWKLSLWGSHWCICLWKTVENCNIFAEKKISDRKLLKYWGVLIKTLFNRKFNIIELWNLALFLKRDRYKIYHGDRNGGNLKRFVWLGLDLWGHKFMFNFGGCASVLD